MYIGIVSPNFSGSTVVGNLLQRFSSVQHVGEIWKAFPDNQRQRFFCRECHPGDCKYFNDEFVNRVRGVDKKDFPKFIYETFGVNHLVSGDKNPSHYQRFTGVPDKVLLLTKNKYSAALSLAKRSALYSEDMDYQDFSELILDSARKYFIDFNERVSWVKENFSSTDVIIASYEKIVMFSDDEMKELGLMLFCDDLNLSENVLTSDLHYVGGNHKVSRGKEFGYFKGKIKPDERYKDVIDEGLMKNIDDVVDDLVKLKDVGDFKENFLEHWVKNAVRK